MEKQVFDEALFTNQLSLICFHFSSSCVIVVVVIFFHVFASTVYELNIFLKLTTRENKMDCY